MPHNGPGQSPWLVLSAVLLSAPGEVLLLQPGGEVMRHQARELLLQPGEEVLA